MFFSIWLIGSTCITLLQIILTCNLVGCTVSTSCHSARDSSSNTMLTADDSRISPGEQIHPMEGEGRQAGAVWETRNHLPGKASKKTVREGMTESEGQAGQHPQPSSGRQDEGQCIICRWCPLQGWQLSHPQHSGSHWWCPECYFDRRLASETPRLTHPTETNPVVTSPKLLQLRVRLNLNHVVSSQTRLACKSCETKLAALGTALVTYIGSFSADAE